MNYKMITYILGWVLKIQSATMVIPLICAFLYNEKNEIWVWTVCIIASALIGIAITLKQPKNKTMYAKEGFVAVALSWILMSLVGSVPFMLSGNIPNFTDSFFESVSGFTTTGASILEEIEFLPHSMLMWRCLSHWIGGMGVLVFLMAIVPLSGGGSVHLLKAETTGPSVSKLVPKLKSTAMLLYAIYIVMTFIQVILLLFGGMDLFSSIAISFSTAGTGGFAILNSGAASYSPYIQYVITIFMILFGIDFSLYHALLLREAKRVLKSEELKVYLGIIITAIVLIMLNSYNLFPTLEEAFRHISFTIGSVITTTGFATTNYDLWPEFSKIVILIVMFVGACAGSTGGGIKVSRVIILIKSIVKEVRTSVHPRTTLKIKMNGRIVQHETIRVVNVFMAAYIMIFFTAMLLLSLDNFNFTTTFTATVATLNNIGPGLDMVGPTGNFSQFSPLSKIIMSICMLVGRLEIFPMLLLLSPYTWKKN